MYTEQDLADIRQQKKKRWMVLGAVLVVLAAILVYSVVVRLEWLSDVCTVVMGAALLFFYDLTIKPLRCYAVHLDNALHGRTRELDCTFDSLSPDVSVVDGVKYRAMTTLEPGKKDPIERMFYFDLNKPFPDLKPGDPLHVVYHDHEVVSLTRL